MPIPARPTFLGVLLLLTLTILMPFGTTNNAAASALEALLAPKANLSPRWAAAGANDTPIDHGPWTDFLGKYLTVVESGANRLDYAAVSATDKQRLAAYIEGLESLAITGYRRDIQFAYWINLYNAATVDLVLQHYPVASIRDIDISPGWISFGPWDADLLVVEDQALSLNDIEHRILRPIWRDPRIHYALNCASVGCPDLQPMAFAPDNTDTLLDTAARAYINSPRGARIENGRLVLSSIYNWFKRDFGGSLTGVRTHLAAFATPSLNQELAAEPRLRGYRYDWSLNDVVR